MKTICITAFTTFTLTLAFTIILNIRANDYWKHRCKAAEAVIETIDNNYYLDVITETDEFSNWVDYK